MDEVVAMSRRELDRLHVIRGVLERRIRQTQASEMLGLGVRQVQRLCAWVRREGPQGIVHRLRGRPSNHQLPTGVLEAALTALHEPLWEGFGPLFACDKLRSLCGIHLSKETVRQLMTQVGLWQPWGRRPRHRGWRKRRDCLGMLVQLDGSTHDWFEGRGPVCVLLVYIDDATSRILYAEFVAIEDTKTLLRATCAYLKQWGRPLAFYVDRDSIYKTNRKATVEEQARDELPMTQFTRAVAELGIKVIAANSPQAKGRVERGFHTHQDRLVKELRLRGMSDPNAANRFLRDIYVPDHNDRYAVVPASSVDAHRPLVPGQDLLEVLSIQTERTVRNDYTIQHNGKWLQIRSKAAVHPKAKVIVQERFDGRVRLLYRGYSLEFEWLPGQPAKAPREAGPRPRRRAPRSRPPYCFKLPSFKPTLLHMPSAAWTRP